MIKIMVGLTAVLAIAAVGIYYFAPGLLVGFARAGEYKAANVTQKELYVAGHRIEYLEGGTGETLLLLHGFGASKDNWPRFAKHFTGKYHVIAVDLPGWGESDYLADESYGVMAQVGRLKLIVDELGLEKYHIMGNSMGGWIAAAYAHTYPDAVLSLGLIDNAGIKTPTKSEFQLALDEGKNLLLVNSAEDFDRILDLVFVKIPDIPRPIKSYLAKKSADRRQMSDAIGRDLFEEGLDLEPLLPDLKMPTFILWGDTDRLIDVSAIEVMEPLLQNSTVVIMENTGHSPMIERPKASAEHYQLFLNGVGE